MPLTIAHLSDLHVSAFGDSFHDSLRLVRRSGEPFVDKRYEPVWSYEGWSILRDRKGKKHRIVDPEGYAHRLPLKKGEVLRRDRTDPIERGAEKVARLAARHASALAANLPSREAVEAMLKATPRNSNLRLIKVAREVERHSPDIVVITGDLTDNGDGYELIERVFAKYVAKRRLFVVPGNHDLYGFPFAGSARPKPTIESKRARWDAFQGKLGLEANEFFAWTKRIDDVAFIGLNSCARPQRRFYRHNGAIGAEQLAFLRAHGTTAEWKSARHRIVMLHHHVVSLAHRAASRPGADFTLRLDDAIHLLGALQEVGATLVMHGHKHLSEERIPAAQDFRLLAAPSTTLGCRSGDAPSYWQVELGENVHVERVRVPMSSVEHDSGLESGPVAPPTR